MPGESRSASRPGFRSGSTIGLDVAVPDFDGEPGIYNGFYSLSSDLMAWRNADFFKEFVLEEARKTAVPQGSWATIKVGRGK